MPQATRWDGVNATKPLRGSATELEMPRVMINATLSCDMSAKHQGLNAGLRGATHTTSAQDVPRIPAVSVLHFARDASPK
jgi:hypothetical protein